MKIIPTCNQYHCLHLFPVLMLSVMITVASSDCNRVCSHGRKRLKVPYPFGFSDGCEIPLNCTEEGRIQIGEFEVNVTDQSIMVSIPSKCNRSIEVLKPLFGLNYAPTLRNGLLVQNCTSPPTRCVVPADLIGSLFKRGCDRPYCYSKMKNDGVYMSMAGLEQSSCTNVLSSVSVAFDRENRNTSLELETIKLGWWLEGECQCSSNAEQRTIYSPVNGRRSCRCWCASGFHGDGFAAGVGCWKDEYYSGLRLKQKLVIGVSIGGVGIFIVLLLIYRKRLYNLYTTAISKNSPNVEEFLKSYGSLSLQRYKFSDIKKMTNFFYKKVGQGGYGSVFEGKLRDGSFVAVKILNESKGDGEEFLNEVDTIGRTNHVNVVRLLGFSIEGTKRALVYEYMSNGSLEKFIYNHNDTSTTTYAHLGWEKLFQITQGIARGLEYLHRGCNDRILHFDIKPHNILLDHDFCPKISDFGLAKLCLTKESYVSMVGARGTVGYIAPELCCRNFGVVSHKSDVYSYGMMVLEMIGGRKNIDTTVENISEIYFPHWIYKQIQQNNNVERQEESIVEESNRNFENATAKRMIIVALWCIQSHPVNRPSMSKVVEMLETNDEIPMPPNPALDPRPTDEMSPISEVKHVLPLNKDNYHKLITSSSG